MASARILAVDDHPPSIELAEAYLLPEGYQVESASDGDEALAMVEASPPDLILLDVLMPRLDGYQVCEALKAREDTRLIPIIMVTSLKDKTDRIKSMEVGADDFLSKPVDKLELLIRVRSLLRIKRLHEDLDHSYRELKTSESAREYLLQMIVHDLKNPLTVVEANLEMMEMKGLVDCQQYLDMSRTHSRQLYHMIQDLYDVSRKEKRELTLNPKSVVFSEVVDSCIQELAAPARYLGKEIEVELESDLPTLEGDRELLYRLLFDLIANAQHYTPQGDKVVLRARLEDDLLQVEIESAGEPIPAEHQASVFEVAGQIETGGLASRGLRLPFCKIAVEAHGGRIWSEAEGRRGMTICFSLPLAQKAAD